MIAGTGQAPIVWLAVWKEVVIAVIFVVGISELAFKMRNAKCEMRKALSFFRGKASLKWKGDIQIILISLMLVIAFAISGFRVTETQFVFGFKYLFVPLIFFLLLSRLEWEKDFLERKVFPAVLIVGGLISLYGIITFFLPMGFFTVLGYSDAHSLYAPGSALSAFQQIGESGVRRVQSTFAGPNQFGLWLLLPFSIALVDRRKFSISNFQFPNNYQLSIINYQLISRLILMLIIASSLILTFSRSAWIAAFAITIYASFILLRGKKRVTLIGALTGIAVMVTVVITFVSPNLILRSISNRHHIERVQEGFVTMIEHPLGLGLGSAGPASNRVSDPCLTFDAGSDISWAKDRDDLCLFVGGVQMQPSPEVKTCKCAFLPENWYVQVGVELGVIGFVLFLVLVGKLLVSGFWFLVRRDYVGSAVFLSFLGISIASLFLHAWEDSAVAYTVWGVVGIVMSVKRF